MSGGCIFWGGVKDHLLKVNFKRTQSSLSGSARIQYPKRVPNSKIRNAASMGIAFWDGFQNA